MTDIVWDRLTAGFARLRIRRQIADYADDMCLLTSKVGPNLIPPERAARSTRLS